MYQLNRRFTLLLLAAVATACSAELHQNRWHDAQYSLRAAEDAGAEDYPPAARLLASARRELMRSRSTWDNGDELNAGLLLDRSEADAQLALQLTRTKHEREKARAAWAEVQTTQLDGR